MAVWLVIAVVRWRCSFRAMHAGANTNCSSAPRQRLSFAEHGRHQIALAVVMRGVGQGRFPIQARTHRVVAERVGHVEAWAIGSTASVFNSESKSK